MTRCSPATRSFVPAALAGLLGACGGGLDRPSEVDGLRVLAVRAEPPEVPSPGTSTLPALVAGAEGAPAFRWSVCLVPGSPYDGYPCLAPEAEIDLGEAETATVAVPPLDDVFASPELRDLHVDLAKGVDVLVRLTVTDPDPPPGDGSPATFEAVKKLRVSTSPTPNRNPTLLGLETAGASWPPDLVLDVDLSEPLDLLPLLAPDAAEPFDDGGEAATEDLVFSWFSDLGSFDRDHSGADSPENTWTPGTREDDPLGEGSEGTIWVVVRDGRGGTDWLSRTVRVATGEP